MRTVPADTLIPNPSNWRTHPVAQTQALRGMLDEIGFADALKVVETPDGLMILDGHARVDQMAGELVPVLILDLTPEEADKYLITADPLSALAESNREAVDALVARTDTERADVRALLETVSAQYGTKPPGRKRGRDRGAAGGEIPNALPGDLWTLGPHRILCADATEPENRARLMDGQEAAMVWCDPPYAIYGSSTGIGSEMSDDKMVRPFFLDVLRMSREAVRTFGHIYVACDWRSWPSWWEMAKRADVTPKNLVIWDKGGSGLGSSYANTYEMVGFFAKLPRQSVMTSDAQRGQRMIHASNLVRYNRVPGGERDHNAQKPVDLVRDMIAHSSDTGDVVVDWFLGSGTTVLAADEGGRVCFGMEIEPRYVDAAVRRWEEQTGGTAAVEREAAPVIVPVPVQAEAEAAADG